LSKRRWILKARYLFMERSGTQRQVDQFKREPG